LPHSAIITEDRVPKSFLGRLKGIKKHIYGYILLENQIDGKVVSRNKNTGRIKRKPLKSKKTISFKDSRLIPIMDKETWNVIVSNYNRSLSEFEEKKFKSNKSSDYLLLEVETNKLRGEFRKYCKKGFHATRHSYVTFAVSQAHEENESESSGLGEIQIRLITGHKSDAFLNYLHIYEEFMLKVQNKKKKNQGKLKLVA
jgi:hypothetical protein